MLNENGESAGTSVTHRLADALARLRFEDLPVAVVDQAKAAIADTLLAAAAGATAPGSARLREAVTASVGASHVWFLPGMRLDCADAAFVNTLHAAALEYDSLNGAVHADLVCLPAAWAIAETEGASGRDMLIAYVAAAEIMSRLSRAALGPSRGWSGTSLYGGLGAAAAVGRLLGLKPLELRHGLGLAASQAAGTQQANVEQTLSKRLQPALSVRQGIFAVRLARAGATAPTFALEGRFGLRALTQSGDDEQVFRGLWDEWQFLDTAFKRYPVCACSHAAVQACLELKSQYGFAARDVQEIEARISPFMERLVGGMYIPGADAQITAQFSLRYHLASCLLRGPLGLADIEPQALKDPAIADLAGRVSIVVDPDNTGELAPATVTIKTVSGTKLEATCRVMPGSSESPLTPAERLSKLIDCAARAEPPLSAASLEMLLERIACLDRAHSLAGIWDGVFVR